MPKLLLALIFFASVSSLFAQQPVRGKLLSTNAQYVSSLVYSKNHNYIGYSVGGYKTVVLNDQLEVVREFTYNPMWGGGQPKFSFDEQYIAYFVYEETDTLIINHLTSNKTIKKPVKVSGIEFFNQSNKILFQEGYSLSLYDLEKDKMIRGVLPHTKGRGYTRYFKLSEDDSRLYVLTRDNTLEIYDTRNWERLKIIGPFDNELNHLAYGNQYVTFCTRSEVYIYDLSKDRKPVKLETPFPYIAELQLLEDEKKVLIAGKSSVVLEFNYETGSSKKLITDIKGKGCYGLLKLKDKKRMLVGDHKELYLYNYE